MSHRDVAVQNAKRSRGGHKREYLVKWLNYDESEATWEPEANVKDLDHFEDYWRTHLPQPAAVPRAGLQ
eukprot:213268-Chlamydomonas_euryale.AAC.1